MKKMVPICGLILTLAASTLLIYTLVASGWSLEAMVEGLDRIQILIAPMMSVASALMFYLAIQELKEEKGRKTNIIMLGAATIGSVVLTVWWVIG